MLRVPDAALSFGFRNKPVGTLASRTIMLPDLRGVFAAVPPTGAAEDYSAAIVEQNVLNRRTASTRKETRRRLREWYGMDPAVLLFRALRSLWSVDERAQPLLALLCAVAREPALRGEAEFISDLPCGATVTPHELAEATARSFPTNYNSGSLAQLGRHAASSWQQAGHLDGRLVKTRGRATSGPSAVAYALLLGHLCGERGDGLFLTPWARLLDADEATLREQAGAASQRGWIEYRQGGGVTEVGFAQLLTESERAVLR